MEFLSGSGRNTTPPDPHELIGVSRERPRNGELSGTGQLVAVVATGYVARHPLRRAPPAQGARIHARRRRLARLRHRLQYVAIYSGGGCLAAAAAGGRGARRRLVDLYTSASDRDTFSTSSLPDLNDYRARNDVFEDIVGYSPMFGERLAQRRPRAVDARGSLSPATTYPCLRRADDGSAGGSFTPEDDRTGAPRVAVISQRYWERELGRDPNVLGHKRFACAASPTRSSASAPREFTGMIPMLAPELWVPMAYADDVQPAGIQETVPSPEGTNAAGPARSTLVVREGSPQAGRSPWTRHGRTSTSSRRSFVPPTRCRTKTGASRYGPTTDTRLHPSGLTERCAGMVTGTDGGGRPRPADRVRERRRHAPGAGVEPAEGNRHSPGDWRRPRGESCASWSPESVLISMSGRRRHAARAVVDAGRCVTEPAAADAVSPRSPDRRARAGVHAGGNLCCRPPRRARAGDSGVEAESGGRPSRRNAGLAGAWRRWSLRDALVAGQMAVTALLLVVAALLTRSLVRRAGHESWLRGEQRGDSLDRHGHAALYERAQPSVLRAGDGPHPACRRRVGRAGDARAAAAERQSREIWVPGSARHRGAWRHHRGHDGVCRLLRDARRPIVEGRGFNNADRRSTPLVAVINETFARRYWPGETAIGKIIRSRALEDGRSRSSVWPPTIKC